VKNPLRSFGVNGHVFFANDTTKSAWVKYKAFKTKNATTLPLPTLFFGKSDNKSGSVKYVSGKDTINKKLATNNILNTLQLGASTKQIKANFYNSNTIPFYGFNFDDGKGIHVDNFSSRGNSGLPLGKLHVELMNAFQQKLGYDLIVLQFGTNVLNYGTLDFTWYEKKMTQVVNHLKQCFPGAAILVVSVADKSTKYEMQMRSDSAVAPLNKAQRNYATKNETGFLNLYTLMGGDGSMVKWVEQAPAKANKDYTHFNHRGAKYASQLIYNQLNEGYEEYKKLRSQIAVKPYVVKVAKQDSTPTIKADTIE
jgi:lysophospholipase L1-like esterase